MIGKILCYFDFHKYELWGGPESKHIGQRCIRCDKHQIHSPLGWITTKEGGSKNNEH